MITLACVAASFMLSAPPPPRRAAETDAGSSRSCAARSERADRRRAGGLVNIAGRSSSSNDGPRGRGAKTPITLRLRSTTRSVAGLSPRLAGAGGESGRSRARRPLLQDVTERKAGPATPQRGARPTPRAHLPGSRRRRRINRAVARGPTHAPRRHIRYLNFLKAEEGQPPRQAGHYSHRLRADSRWPAKRRFDHSHAQHSLAQTRSWPPLA